MRGLAFETAAAAKDSAGGGRALFLLKTKQWFSAWGVGVRVSVLGEYTTP